MQKILEKFMKKYWKNAKKTGKVREIRQFKKVGTMWCQCWHHHLCTPLPGTGLDIETSYLENICTYVPHVFTSNIY